MSLRIKNILFGILIAGSLGLDMTYGHGEDKLGPHGGFIRMPGAFHTEVLKKNSKLLIYLLDINWKNPIVDGFVKVSIKKNKSEIQLQCTTLKNNFECNLPKNEKLESGELILLSKRGTFPEATATYSLPLKLTKAIDEHKKHH